MANVWFLVLVLIFVNNVFASLCPVRRDILNCDQCMRCGGNWCGQPKTGNEHCSSTKEDDWCEKLERPTHIAAHDWTGSGDVPRSLMIGVGDRQPFRVSSPHLNQASPHPTNSTQNKGYVVVAIEQQKCEGTHCKGYILTKINSGFCSENSTDIEFVEVAIKVENATMETITYHVPCACACSKHVEIESSLCSGHGNYTCGACSCRPPWSGSKCSELNCEGRGDVSTTCRSDKNNMICSGNGFCNECDTCECFTNTTGSQYFNREQACSDICMDTSGCERCLTNGTLGACDRAHDDADCEHDLLMLKYDEATGKAKDDLNRDVWVRCNNTFKDPICYVEYLTMKSADGIKVMVVKSCNDRNSGYFVGIGETKVPMILGILGVVATVAAVSGVLLWKHLHAAPAMPFASPDYQNIDAEDCVGENPLYKSPTSTFTNPQFGKI